MIIGAIEEALGKNLPQSYKEVVASIEDFEYIEAPLFHGSDTVVSWFFWGRSRLAETIHMDGALDRPAWNIIASFGELDKKFRHRSYVPSTDGPVSFDRLRLSVAIAEDNGDYLYLDSPGNFSLWMYFHDSGEVRKIADSFKGWLNSAVRD
ncbi:MAG: SMI1/KNR4 family protein [Proteobacteria bacterium]|nr:SMI1/KNR4 family protein [Pseudomonadota bacterium]